MLSIICNLKFLYKFFQSEDFGSLTDAEFERLEQSLEATERLIEAQRVILAEKTGVEAQQTLRAMDRFSGLVDQFWAQEVSHKFLEELEQAAQLEVTENPLPESSLESAVSKVKP